MIPWPQDIPGSITLVFIIWWFKGFKIAKDVADEYRESNYDYNTKFVISLLTQTAILFCLRVIILLVWC